MKVIHCLEKHPKTRNSDMLLTRAVWHEFHNSKGFMHNGRMAHYDDDLMDLPREDEVSRIRRKVTENGEYLPTDPEVYKQRKINEINWREDMSPSNPARG